MDPEIDYRINSAGETAPTREDRMDWQKDIWTPLVWHITFNWWKYVAGLTLLGIIIVTMVN